MEAKDSVAFIDLHVLICIFMDGYVFYCFYIAFTYEHLQRLTDLLRLILISELNMIKSMKSSYKSLYESNKNGACDEQVEL